MTTLRSVLLLGAIAAALALTGLYRISRTSAKPEEYDVRWTATRPLPGNHQLVAGDLGYPAEPMAAARLLLDDTSAAGMHLIGAAKRGDMLGKERISPRPHVQTSIPSSQVYFYVLKEDITPVGGWTEGASVIPCYKTPGTGTGNEKERTVCIHTPLPILAIHKSTASAEASWLALEIPNELRCTFAAFALADKRLLMQVKPN